MFFDHGRSNDIRKTPSNKDRYLLSVGNDNLEVLANEESFKS
jgi:hypothetical protein